MFTIGTRYISDAVALGRRDRRRSSRMKHALFPCSRRRPCHFRFRFAAENHYRRTRSVDNSRIMHLVDSQCGSDFRQFTSPDAIQRPPRRALSQVLRPRPPPTSSIRRASKLLYGRRLNRTGTRPRRKRLNRQHRSFQNNRLARPNRSGWILRDRKSEVLFGTLSKVGTLSHSQTQASCRNSRMPAKRLP